MRLVKATIHDLNTIYYILQDGRQQLADLGINQWQADEPSAKQIVADIEAGEAWLYQNQNYEVIGTAALKITSNQEPTFGNWPLTVTSYGMIRRMAIRSADTGKGHGLKLLTLMLTDNLIQQEMIQSIRIEIPHDNHPIQQLCTKLDFVKIDDVTSIYSDSQQNYVYEKLLPDLVC